MSNICDINLEVIGMEESDMESERVSIGWKIQKND